MTTTRMTKADKLAMQVILEKHQKKHPGCKISERRCKSKLSEECIVKGDSSLFHPTAATCKKCISVVNRNFYQNVTSQKEKKV